MNGRRLPAPRRPQAWWLKVEAPHGEEEAAEAVREAIEAGNGGFPLGDLADAKALGDAAARPWRMACEASYDSPLVVRVKLFRVLPERTMRAIRASA